MEILNWKYIIEFAIYFTAIPIIIRTFVNRMGDQSMRPYTITTMKVWGLYLVSGLIEYLFWIKLLTLSSESSPFPRIGFNTPLGVLLTFLAADLSFYLSHTISHKIRILWVAHIPHHSIKHFSFADGVRVGFFDDKILGLAFPTLFVFLGIDPLPMYVCYRVCLDSQLLVHTQKVGKIPVFDLIFNSPSNHRVHHSREAEHLDRNMGGYTMLWDHLFGTYQREGETMATKYGITVPLNSNSLYEIYCREFINLSKDFHLQKTLLNKLKVLYRQPELDKERSIGETNSNT